MGIRISECEHLCCLCPLSLQTYQRENQAQIALELQGRLNDLIALQPVEEPEPVTEWDSENSYDLRPAPVVEVVEPKASESEPEVS